MVQTLSALHRQIDDESTRRRELTSYLRLTLDTSRMFGITTFELGRNKRPQWTCTFVQTFLWIGFSS